MDDARFTRPYLESLSTNELVKLADSLGIDIPPGLERIFIIEELLELGFGDDLDTEDDIVPVHADFLETAALPKQYNISYIDVLIRDPLWAFVFWEIKGHDREIHEKALDFGGYCLRVIPLTDGVSRGSRASRTEMDNSLTVPVGPDDTAWYLGFPPAEGKYQVELCVLRGSEERVIRLSRPFKLPRLLEPPSRKAALPGEIQEVYRNPLACLSGAKDFPVIRSADRLSRLKKNDGAVPVNPVTK
jgi:hypothetical protein